VRQAVDVAGAERIGHGADVTYENDPDQLLKDMAAKHVLVEINLSSNEDVLGMVGENHPLPIYRKSGVPVTLSTDDEGIERIDLTHEWRESVVQSRLRPLVECVRGGHARNGANIPSMRELPQGKRKGRAAMGNSSGGLPLSRQSSRIAHAVAASDRTPCAASPRTAR
jgi:hypothetical protein